MPTTEEDNMACRMRKLTESNKNWNAMSPLYVIRLLIEKKASVGLRFLEFHLPDETSAKDDQATLNALVFDGFAVKPITAKIVEITW
jgi:hypothetical protein